MENIYGVIMAGGGGTRFWPLSRQKTPKQLLNLTGKDLLINEAIERLKNVVERDNIFIVTNSSQISAMQEAVDNRIQKEHILAEPAARNTAACIGYAAVEIVKKYGDGVMIVTPSDHFIEDTDEFSRVLKLAADEARKTNKLITIGIKPNFPATGFGYIKYSDTQAEVKQVLEFIEKPDECVAQKYVESNVYAWNSGMFVWRASLILEKFKEFIPDIHSELEKIGDSLGTSEEKTVLEAVYPNIRKISIDYAIMEPAALKGDVLVISGEFGWNDVGSYDMLDVLHRTNEYGNIEIGDTLAVDTKNSILFSSKKIVTTLGVENLIIIETEDAVMVCNKNRAQDVKKIVDRLMEKERKELL